MLGSFEQVINAFLLDRRASGLSPGTIATYKVHLHTFARWCQAHDVAFDQLTADYIRMFLAERQAQSQMRLIESYRRLRPFFRWVVAERYGADLMACVKHPKEPKRLMPALTVSQVKMLLALCSGESFVQRRDMALIRLLLDCGLRISEALKLRLEDVDLDEGKIVIHSGKGRKDRVVYAGHRTRQTLVRYLRVRKAALSHNLLFTNREGLSLTRRHAHQQLARIARRAGIEGVRVSPHILRHTFATWYLRNGGDVFSLQRLLGHASLSMTQRYLYLTESDVSAAHEKFSPGQCV